MGEHSKQYDSARFPLQMFAFAWAHNLFLPRLSYRLRWPTRLTGWPLVAYVALMAAQGMAIRYWVLPWFKRMGEVQMEERAELRVELGREPTDDEFFEWKMEREN